jgi:Rrf2 family protein
MSLKLSTKGRYGLRAMIDLARHHGEGPVLVRSIAERQEVSSKYLHALLASLKAAKLVRSVRGSGGGYTLARPARDIHVIQILEALEGPIAVVDCVADAEVCNRAETCATRDLWTDLSRAFEDTLTGLTLEELSRRQEEKEASV